MEANNETHAEIVSKVRSGDYGCAKCGDLCDCHNTDKIIASIIDRIEAAHKRELSEKDGELKGLHKANDSLAADNDRLRREVTQLRDCMKIIRDNLVTHTIKSADGKYVNNGGFLSEEFVDDERLRKALEGAKDVKNN